MQSITLNITPDGTNPAIYVNQYDVGREFTIFFKEGLRNYTFPTPVTFKINGRKSDGHVFEYSESDKWDDTHYVITKDGTGSSLVVIIATTEQMTAAAGKVEVQLTFGGSETQTNAVIGTLNFVMFVQEQPYANGDPSGSEFPAIIEEATAQMEAAAASAEAAENAVRHYPYINNTNKDWMLWDAENEQWVDTGVRAQAIDGPGSVQTVDGVAPDLNGDIPLKWGNMSSITNLAPVEMTRTMTFSHAAGSFLFVVADDQFYQVGSTQLDPPATLTPGTNATAKSIADVLGQLNSQLTNKESYSFVDVSACSSYAAIVDAMQTAKTNEAYGSVGGASSGELRALLGAASLFPNLAYVGAVIHAYGTITANPVLQIFIYEQTNTIYDGYAKMCWVYPIGNTYHALPWINAH